LCARFQLKRQADETEVTMSVQSMEFDAFLERYRQALVDIINGSAELYRALYSQRDDVTLANPFAPFGPISRGYAQVCDTVERAASNYRVGESIGFDTIAVHHEAGFAYLVEVERFRATMAGREEMAPVSLRVTSIFRQEDGEWRIIHRHADPITTARSADSVLAE
jgi:ketosteroid isomerase-like protein